MLIWMCFESVLSKGVSCSVYDKYVRMSGNEDYIEGLRRFFSLFRGATR